MIKGESTGAKLTRKKCASMLKTEIESRNSVKKTETVLFSNCLLARLPSIKLSYSVLRLKRYCSSSQYGKCENFLYCCTTVWLILNVLSGATLTTTIDSVSQQLEARTIIANETAVKFPSFTSIIRLTMVSLIQFLPIEAIPSRRSPDISLLIDSSMSYLLIWKTTNFNMEKARM